VTDVVPATLTSRQAPGGTVMPASTSTAVQLPYALQLCNAIAGAGDLLMPCYRGKPGAVLLAYLWAEANGVDTFTALQNIYPIQGKAYVGADLRVNMATAKGYDVRTIESNSEVCRLDVTDPKGRTTTVIAHMPAVPVAGAQGVITVTPAPGDLRKDGWKDRPGDMLYALACRVADRRVVRSGAALLDVAQDWGGAEPLDVLAPAGDAEGGGRVSDQTADAPDVDGEPIAAEAEGMTPAYLLDVAARHGVKGQVALLKQARSLGWPGGSLAELAADDEWANRVLDWVEDQ
jgi:hypothetical protein